MRPTTVLMIAAGLFQTTAAFRCAIGQYGSCTFRKSSTSTTRCAIACKYKGLWNECSCPPHYPNRPNWEYTGKHGCISQGQFDGRNQCQNPNPNGK
ncbi:hypothetical protein PspLS_07109, partial [Pyricularia sp. CBS 133598]